MTNDTKKNETLPVLKPGQVMRLVNRKILAGNIDCGKIKCEKCRNTVPGNTESPTFWENGSYVHCPNCDAYCLARPVYPATQGYLHGFEIDLTGERKAYPVEMASG